MPSSHIDYSRLVERALRRVLHDALEVVERQGLPGRHHLYITFRTQADGVRLSDALRARYPSEMTIVLQHEFWALEVDETGFGVTLSFGGCPERIIVPLEAVTVFADPSVEFGLQFQGDAPAPARAAPEAPAREAPVEELPKRDGEAGVVTALPKPDGDDGADDGSAEVVTLDQFRKK